MQKHQAILKKFKNKRTGVFIDDANIFHIQKELGWEIDWNKLKKFLEKHFRIKFIKYYLGMPTETKRKVKNEILKQSLEETGFEVITKPLKKIYLDSKKKDYLFKCNFDVEIAFDIAKNIDNLSLVIICSGDSDFLEAKNFCLEKGKSFLFLCFEKRVVWEIRRVYHLFFEEIKNLIKK